MLNKNIFTLLIFMFVIGVVFPMTNTKNLCEEYEKNYGPLTTDSKFIGENNWKWIKSPWPWEGTK